MKTSADNFIDIPFTESNLDLFVIRNSILRAMNENLPLFRGRFLDVGCGKMPYREYISKHSAIEEYVGLDIETAIEYDANVKADFTWDGITMPFDEESFDTAMATEVLEHCPDPMIILGEINRVLKPGGLFFFTTPFFWNLHEVPHDEYRYTPFSIERILRAAGFTDIKVKAMGGWHASMAQMLGMWARRAPMSASRRRMVSVVLKPVIAKLLKMGSAEKIDYNKAPMINTICGIATKESSATKVTSH